MGPVFGVGVGGVVVGWVVDWVLVCMVVLV